MNICLQVVTSMRSYDICKKLIYTGEDVVGGEGGASIIRDTIEGDHESVLMMMKKKKMEKKKREVEEDQLEQTGFAVCPNQEREDDKLLPI